ncbi:MAG TPA: zf-HC2 domain-containing protein [Streptosporangiaceae bacterium]|nr:zf-HC2 domain-containing protein [Streptosporangiaceae bacterium]
MNGMTSCPEIRQLLGVYVVGAIDPSERALVDSHLSGCPGCREELASLAALPALLGRIPIDEAARISGDLPERSQPGQEPEAELLHPLLGRVRHQRRVRRWRTTAAAAAVAAAVAGLSAGVTSALQSPASPRPSAVVRWETKHAINPVTRAAVVVKYRSTAWGTQIETNVSGIAAGTACALWVTGAGGKSLMVASWTEADGWHAARTWYMASTWVPAHAVKSFEIMAGNRMLVSVPAT